MADDAATDDERTVELASISAIYPELIFDPQKPYSASIHLDVIPSSPLPVTFPESTDGASVATVRLQDGPLPPANEVHLISHLPSLQLHISLPDGYPARCPPTFELSTTPSWLTRSRLENLKVEGHKLWEELGHDQVVFAYIDYLQQSAENAFGALDQGGQLPLGPEVRIGVLDFDIKAKKAAFEKETFDCGICLDPKKGTGCHRMLDCGHVFCRNCLQEFYNNAITTGDIASVKCLTFGCARDREKAALEAGRKRPRTNISPSELLQIPMEHEVVKRYVDLRHKAQLESDKNTIYCPRQWCQGAARSKKHRKPESLETVESSDDDEEEDDTANKKGYIARDDLLAICEDCSFAFCRRCFQGWHGEFTMCAPRTNTGELTEEDKASLEYLKLHTTPCPTCAAPAQKTHGCNHMICFRCNTHFCYLCSSWLEPGNPYQHFNNITTPCYMRLWELEGGDGEGVGHWFQGGEDEPDEVEIVDQFNVEDFDDNSDAEDDAPVRVAAAGIAVPAGAHVGVEPIVHGAPAALPNGVPAPRPVAPQIEREAPLVLRIGALPAPAVRQQEHAPALNRADRVLPRRQAAPRAALRGNALRRGRGGARIAPQAPPAPRARRGAIAQGMHGPLPRQPEVMNAEDQAWVQRFVAAALNDEEDMIDDHDHNGR